MWPLETIWLSDYQTFRLSSSHPPPLLGAQMLLYDIVTQVPAMIDMDFLLRYNPSCDVVVDRCWSCALRSVRSLICVLLYVVFWRSSQLTLMFLLHYWQALHTGQCYHPLNWLLPWNACIMSARWLYPFYTMFRKKHLLAFSFHISMNDVWI